MKKISTKGAKAKAWKAFSRWVRLNFSDKDGFCECVTCGDRHYWTEVQAGHFVGGRKNSVLIHEELVRPQCCSCNHPFIGNGEQARFALYLMNREGKTQEEIDSLLRLKNKTVQRKAFEWLQIAEEYNNKADALMALKRI